MEFVCPDPKATVRAANVRATLEAFSLMPSIARSIMERHDLRLDDLRPENFVPVQRWLDALRELQGKVGVNVIRQVGTFIVVNADFPPIFTSVESVLLALDQIYYVNHRGNVGHYHSSRAADGTITIRCETPYPRYFELGLVEGICGNKKAADKRYHVEFIDGIAGTDLTCTLNVRAV